MAPESRLERLSLGAIGSLPPAELREIARRLSLVLPIPCTAATEPLPVAPQRMAGRDQSDADRMLTAVEALSIEPGTAICGVTAEDIGHPLFTHFFGRARRDGHAMVVSLARLDPTFYGLPANDPTLHRRACLEVLHEFGHLAGLGHCEDYRCIMRFAPSVEAIDTRGDWFCDLCAPTFELAVRACSPRP